MKHCIVQSCIILVLGVLGLPCIYAQDTTITIYGKNFSPEVIVKLNGTAIPQANIRHDLLKPSRILYVTFPLAWLQIPSALAVGKEAGASLSSNEIGNIVSVGNPGNLEANFATYTIYTKPASPRIWITQANTTDSLRSLRLRVPLNSRRDTLLRINFLKLPVGAEISLQLSDSSRFSLYDSTNTKQLWSFTTKANSNTYAVTVRYNAPSALLQKDQVTLKFIGRQNSKTIIQRSFPLEGVPIQTVQIMAAFTAGVMTKRYYDTSFVGDPNNPTIPRELQEDVEKTLNNPQQLMEDYLRIFNTYLANEIVHFLVEIHSKSI